MTYKMVLFPMTLSDPQLLQGYGVIIDTLDV